MAEALLKEADEFFQEDMWPEAVDKFSQLMRVSDKYSEHPLVRLNFGMCLYENEEYERAEESYEKAGALFLQQDTVNQEFAQRAFFNLGQCQFKL